MTSSSWDDLSLSMQWQCLHNLRDVFDRFREAGLKLKPSKCTFGQKKVAFPGHIVSDKGVATDPAKVAAITNWPTPRSRKEVQQFLGLGNYYRRFIKDFATIAKPLHRLTETGREFCGRSHVKRLFGSSKVNWHLHPSLHSRTLHRHLCWTLMRATKA